MTTTTTSPTILLDGAMKSKGRGRRYSNESNHSISSTMSTVSIAESIFSDAENDFYDDASNNERMDRATFGDEEHLDNVLDAIKQLQAETRAKITKKVKHIEKPLIANASSDIVTTGTNKKRVRFGSLEIHEHALRLGGSSVPSSGPSMTLEWEEQACYRIKSVELFENSRPFPQRRGMELLQSTGERIGLLLEAGHTLTEINSHRQENDMIRKQRWKSMQKDQRFPLLSKILKVVKSSRY